MKRFFKIKPVYATILAIGLVLLIFGVIWYIESTKYTYYYRIQETVIKSEYTQKQPERDLASRLAPRNNVQLYDIFIRTETILPKMRFILAKDEILKCKLEVVSEDKEKYFVVYVTDDEAGNIVIDSGKIEAGSSYNFSVKAKHTWTGYTVSFQSYAEYARFYSNLCPLIKEDVSVETTRSGTIP